MMDRPEVNLNGKRAADTVDKLARVVCAAQITDIPAAAIHQAQLLLLDTIGCAIAGSREVSARAVADVALQDGGGDCALIGRAQRASLLNAVLANGVAMRVLDLNDYLIGESHGAPETAGHPSDNIPVALGVGAARQRTGSEILGVIAIGYELYARLQAAMNRDGAWDSVTVSGIVAPAMAGLLMDLDEGRLAHAIALGAARAATPAIVRTGHISSAKTIANALLAQAGVQAALLAEAGLTGPLPILDEARGLRDLLPNAQPSLLTAPITYGAIALAHVKAYPCVNTGQTAVAAALKLHAMLEGGAQSLNRIEIVMADYPSVKRHQEDPARLRPQSREAADHSFPFLVAVTLQDGAFGLAQFESARWRDPKIVALMEKITMRRDSAWNARAPGGFPCSLLARDSRGHEFIAEAPTPPGFSKNGLDQTAVIQKFHAVTAPHLDEHARASIVDAVMELNDSRSTATLDNAIATEGTTKGS
jgi:2-methylcitrate dehydratase